MTDTIDIKSAEQYMATLRKTLRFAETTFGISCSEQPVRETTTPATTNMHIEIQIIDEKCPTSERFGCHYTTLFTFKKGKFKFTKEFMTAVYQGGDVVKIEQHLFEPVQLPEDVSIYPLTAKNKDDVLFYERKNDKKNRFTENYIGIEGAHSFVARSTLKEILTNQNQPLSEIIKLTDDAMALLKPENYEETFADNINRIPIRPKKQPFFSLVWLD